MLPDWLVVALAVGGISWFVFGPDALEYLKSLWASWTPDVDDSDLVPEPIDVRLEYLQLVLELRDIFSDDQEVQEILDKLQLKITRVSDEL